MDQAERVMGVTESIESGTMGLLLKEDLLVVLFLIPAIYDVNDALYLSSTVGEFTNVRPSNFITKIG